MTPISAQAFRLKELVAQADSPMPQGFLFGIAGEHFFKKCLIGAGHLAVLRL
jgi:hypothetical protein